MVKVSRTSLINWTICIEAFLLLVATGWSQYAGIPLMPKLLLNINAILIGVGTGCAMALFGWTLFIASRKSSALNNLRELIETHLLPMISELKGIDLVILAVLSGFCEEVFFRGVAQAQLGPVVTSICFGLFHDPTFRHPLYAVLAFGYGMVLSELYLFTGSLWAPIVAHMVHNMISLYLLRYRVKPPASTAEG